MDDFLICRRYDDAKKTNIGIVVPVDDKGYMTDEAGKFAGLYYEKANAAILEELKSSGALLASQEIEHQYAHCWRCKEPILYRATDQWFCSVEAFKDNAIDACKSVIWTPAWGGERMVSMIQDRADWCISRQRHWGLPIPVFYCSDCGKSVCNDESIAAVSELFEHEGSNGWFEKQAGDILPQSFKCPHCGGTHFEKESDTLDGWFDSGSSHIACLEKDYPEYWPADLYLEGADQYRGWFQSSMLTSVATRGRSPYKAVLTHGWVVDGEGKAMHKSLGNSIAPEEIINKFGGDLLRLWVASSDYRVDVRVSDAIFKQLSEAYLKIRNTARYILGNLNGFDPDSLVAFDELQELDKWALVRLGKLINKVKAGYEAYEFHTVYHAVHNFCAVDMSSFYLDIIKDRLYCEGSDSKERRSAQTAMYIVLDNLVRMLAPVLAFTAEEIWQAMAHDSSADSESVMFNEMKNPDPAWVFDAQTEERWNKLLRLRDDVNKALELARSEKIVGKPLDAEVTLYVSDEAEFASLKDMPLAELFIVSKVDIGSGEGFTGSEFESVSVKVAACTDAKCVRCWRHCEDIGVNSEHPELCGRCAAVVSK